MDKREKREGLTIFEAVDYLSNLAELDPKKAQEKRSEEQEKNKGLVKEAFRTVHNYLRHMYESDRSELKEPETQRGIQAMMVLAGEAAANLDRYTALFKGTTGRESVTQIGEYKELQQFYLTKIIKRFQASIETEEVWQKEWSSLEGAALDIEKRGLKDLENVRRDGDYELFYLRKEDGKPFFNRNLLRHIRLVGTFDESLTNAEGDDPLTKIKVLEDKDMQISAKNMLDELMPYVDAFYKEALRHKERDFVTSLNKSLMALMLAANGRNLLGSALGKSCISYFSDFQLFLREAFHSSEYQKLIASPPTSAEAFWQATINLSHGLCCYFFLREPNRAASVELIHRLIARGQTHETVNNKVKTSLAFWNDLLDQDESMRAVFKLYPSGPLLRVLDAFRQDESKEGFDPILQSNLPAQMYTISYDHLDANCLHLPCPTKQESIDKAEIIPEFKGFLRFLRMGLTPQSHFLINLQDRTSWKEHARSTAIEELQKSPEFSRSLTVVSLPKNTDFYFQSEDYLDSNDAQSFLAQFGEQIASGEECGFYFPTHLKSKEMQAFAQAILPLVHQHFFDSRKELNRKDRLDFIEVVYYLLVLKCLDLLKPGTFSFTCKDGIDTGAAMSAGFFAFLKMLANPQAWSQQERDFMLWMLYAPAVMVRERSVDLQRINRTLSSLVAVQVALDANRPAILKALAEVYGNDFLSTIKIQETKEEV
jgi:hypothetical protein